MPQRCATIARSILGDALGPQFPSDTPRDQRPLNRDRAASVAGM
jgi:hypothetical protein